MSEIGSTTLQLTRNVKLKRTILTPFVCSVAAAFGIFGGISALFVGIVFVVIHSFAAGEKIFDQVGTGLLIAAIPMILIGSIFLDMIEGSKK